MSIQNLFLTVILIIAAFTESSFAADKSTRGSSSKRLDLFEVGISRHRGEAVDDFKWGIREYQSEREEALVGHVEAVFVSSNLKDANYPPDGPQSRGPFDH